MNNPPLRYVSALLLTLLIGAIAWFELVYFYFGATGEDPTTAFNIIAAAAGFGVPLVWMLRGTTRPAEVVRRGCRVGYLAAVLLPLVSFAVLFMWQNSSGRRDLGMGGLMLYSLPFIAIGVALVLLLIFWVCDRFAAKRLRTV